LKSSAKYDVFKRGKIIYEKRRNEES